MSDLLLMASSPLRYLLSIPGTVALYLPYMDVVGRNLLPVGSEDFQTEWLVSSGVTPVITGNQADPDGGTSAYRIQTTGGTSVVKHRTTTPPGTGSNGIGGIWYKVNSGKVRFGLANLNTDLLTSTSWAYVSFTGGASPRFYIGVESASDNLDITVYQPQINLGQLYPYSAPVGLSQSVVDRSGLGNHAQLGSTSGVDTNDPLWTHVSNYFDGVDDVYSNWPEAEYELHAWGNTINSFGWVSAVPTETVGHYFGGILLNRTPGAGEEARIKGAMRALLASRGVALA